MNFKGFILHYAKFRPKSFYNFHRKQCFNTDSVFTLQYDFFNCNSNSIISYVIIWVWVPWSRIRVDILTAVKSTVTKYSSPYFQTLLS
jgi:hypothetical protein